MAILKTIGIFVVTALAATAEAVPGVTITVTRRRTRSVASDDNRSYWPSAPRYSIATFWPSIWLGDHAIENARAWHSVKWRIASVVPRPQLTMIALAPHLFELFRFAERNLKSFPYDTWVDYASWMINVRKLLWRKDREDRTGKLKSRNSRNRKRKRLGLCRCSRLSAVSQGLKKAASCLGDSVPPCLVEEAGFETSVALAKCVALFRRKGAAKKGDRNGLEPSHCGFRRFRPVIPG